MTLTSFPAAASPAPCAPELAVSVLETVGLACAVVERDTQRVVWWSDALRLLSGLESEQVVHRALGATLLDPVSAAFATGCCPAGVDQAGAVTFRGTLATVDRTVPVAWTVSALAGDPAGRHVLLVAVDQRREAPRSVVLAHVAANGVDVPVLGTDLDGRVTYCSRAMERLLGRGATELLSHPLPLTVVDGEQLRTRAGHVDREIGLELFLLHPDRYASDEQPAEHQRRLNPEEEGVDWTVVRPDGSTVVASVHVQPVSDASGTRIGYLAWAIDVTEERRSRSLLVKALDKEREAAQRLAELDATRNDFVATTSHELRTPVTSIRGYAELMADGVGSLSSRDAMFVEAILRNADRLCALADDLLVLSDMDAGSGALDLRLLDLRDVVEACAESARSRGLSSAVTVAVDVPDQPLTVDGDPCALDRVVDHLVRNAVKFTDVGTVTCTLREEDGTAVLEVADTGVGIPEHEQPSLFTRFYRTAEAHQRAIPGSGLGLSVAHTLVEAHHGELTLRSAPGEGTTVTVRLPLHQIDARRTLGTPA